MLNIKNNTILVIPNNIKNFIIKDVRNNFGLLNIKFMSLTDIVKLYYFDYNEKSIYYIMQKYHTNYDIALTYIKNIYYLKDTITNSKQEFLYSVKQELINNNLLIFNSLFKDYIKDKNIIIYGYNYFTKLEKNLIEELKPQTNLEIINNKYNYSHNHIYMFSNIEEEIGYVAIKIRELLTKNISPNNITLGGINKEYYFYLKQIFKFYNIPLDNIEPTYLSNTNIGIYFLNNINDDINITLELITKKFNLNNPTNQDQYDKIIDILNKYTWINNKYTSIKEMLKHELNNTIVNNNSLFNCVKITDLKNYPFNDDEYVFLMSFNNETIPHYYIDDDYLLDKEKENVLVYTKTELNMYEKECLITAIKNIKNLTITAKTSSLNGIYTISSLNDILNYEIITNTDISYNYSELYNQLKLASYLDNFIKYNEISPDLSLLYNNYPNINYKKYDNSYSPIDKVKYLEYINSKITLSYSSLDNYYHCAFKYYLSNVLRLNLYEETFMIIIGKVFHYILSIAFTKNNIDIDYEYNNYLSNLNKEFTSKEKFFFKKLKEELKFIVATIKKQYQNTTFLNSVYEEEINIDLSKNINIKFTGFIDKLMYKEKDDCTIVAIIDYKTGDTAINLDNITYGFNMQLPIYLYLAKNSNKLTNIKFTGFYLQKLLHSELNIDPKHTYQELKEKNLLLEGYSINNQEYLKEFDESYLESKMIKSLKVKNDGNFYSYSKILSEDDMNNLINIVYDNINKSIEPIINANFEINPKNINGAMIGCKFCKYNDICYKKEEDTIYIKNDKVGETNEMD